MRVRLTFYTNDHLFDIQNFVENSRAMVVIIVFLRTE